MDHINLLRAFFTLGLNVFSCFVILTSCDCFFTHSKAQAIEPYFDVTLNVRLCPEYKFGFIALDTMYRIGNDTQLHAANVLSQNIDTDNDTATIVVRMPGTYTSVPFKLLTLCRSAIGFGPASNEVEVSNCDRLAKLDSDADGIPNNQEDTNCDNFYSPGDASNPDNLDTDGDGVRDLVEALNGADPSNPGSSPRPYIFSSSPYDPDGDNMSNPVVWRPNTGTWYVNNDANSLAHQSFVFGQSGDVPFFYKDINQISNVGVIRRNGVQLNWYFRGTGFTNSSNQNNTSLTFGVFGDNIILGPWETPGVTSPAVARLFNNVWTFDIYQRDGSVRSVTWGGNGDIPKPQDFDGDGLFDVAVFRPSTQTTYIIQSSDGVVSSYNFGTGTADHTVRGDYTGDNKDEIALWEPINGLFTALTSDNGFDTVKAQAQDPLHYKEIQLGEYIQDLPLSWTFDGAKSLFTVVNHSTGIRKSYPDNDANNQLTIKQWGLAGDSQG